MRRSGGFVGWFKVQFRRDAFSVFGFLLGFSALLFDYVRPTRVSLASQSVLGGGGVASFGFWVVGVFLIVLSVVVFVFRRG